MILSAKQTDEIWDNICWLLRIGLRETGYMIFDSYFSDWGELKITPDNRDVYCIKHISEGE